MRHLHVDRMVVIACCLVGAGACATMTPPMKSSGPASSPTGIQIAVVRQLCAESLPFDAVNAWINETVELEVRNGSADPISIHPDKFRLRAPNDSVVMSGSSTDPVMVGKGETQTLQLTFSSRSGSGGLECKKAMRLDASAAITSGESPVALSGLAFVPSL